MKEYLASIARAALQIGGTIVASHSSLTVTDFNTLAGAGMAIAGIIAGQLSAKKKKKLKEKVISDGI